MAGVRVVGGRRVPRGPAPAGVRAVTAAGAGQVHGFAEVRLDRRGRRTAEVGGDRGGVVDLHVLHARRVREQVAQGDQVCLGVDAGGERRVHQAERGELWQGGIEPARADQVVVDQLVHERGGEHLADAGDVERRVGRQLERPVLAGGAGADAHHGTVTARDRDDAALRRVGSGDDAVGEGLQPSRGAHATPRAVSRSSTRVVCSASAPPVARSVG